MELKRKIGDKVRVKATNEEGVVTKLNYEGYEVKIYFDGIKFSHFDFREAELCDPINNMNYKQYIISKGGVEIGLSFYDIEEYLLTPAQYREFETFMKGQTCGEIGRISICYTCDFERFIKGLPVVD